MTTSGSSSRSGTDFGSPSPALAGQAADTPPPASSLPGGAGAGHEPLRVLFVGRPNAGKSTLFNLVTGGDAHVGNFPGLTVDALEGTIALEGGATAQVVDLPGVYSIESATDPATDEGVTRAYLDAAEAAGGRVLIVQVIDGSRLALGLRLTAELLRRRALLAVVVTQEDVLESEGRALDVALLEAALGVPVLGASARNPSTRPRLFTLLARASSGELALAPSHPHAIDGEALARRAIKDRTGVDALARRRRERTARIDAVLLHPVLGPFTFLGIMLAVFAAVFVVADPASKLLDAGTRALAGQVEALVGHGLLSSFLVAGVFGGAGTVLAFLPQIVILTIAMEIIEASGYLARGAFLVDRMLRAAGLGGRSFVPLLTAHACAVPAVQATRAIRDPGQRLRTILVLPLMTCSARIPTYGLLIATFFAAKSALFQGGLFIGLYLAGIVAGLVASLILGRAVRRTARSLPLVLEMPAYRMPRPRVILRVALRTCVRFVKDVGTVILIASIVLWGLLTVPGPGAPPEVAKVNAHHASPVAVDAGPQTSEMERSIAAWVGRKLEPVTKAAGFDWRINVGLIGSFGARELMVSTLGVIVGMEGGDRTSVPDRLRAARAPDGSPAYGTATALALMAFFVLACQCQSTLATIYRETRSFKWPTVVFAYTYTAGFVAAVLVYRIAHALGA